VGAIRTAWSFGFALALLASAGPGWALPSAPSSQADFALSAEPLLLIRHHHRHGHWRHRRPHGFSNDEPAAAIPEAAPPAVSASPLPVERPLRNTPGATNRGSGSSRPAIRWVDPEKSPRCGAC
jgi:hypothetical protein